MSHSDTPRLSRKSMENLPCLDQEFTNTQACLTESGSLYVKLFDHIYSTVLEKESYLFTEIELDTLKALRSLSYASRYLLIRLSLRKRQKWHTVVSLEKSYGKDLGDKERISSIIDELCGLTQTDVPVAQGSELSRSFIDLTADSKDELDTPKSCYTFAEDENVASLSELLYCLPLESLKRLGKEMKITYSKQTRDVLVKKIVSYCCSQTTLTTYFRNQREKPNKRYFLGHKKSYQSQVHFRKQILKETGRCVRLRQELLEVFDNLNIIFFRSTKYDPSLFLPALLDAFHKRIHASFDCARTSHIFPTRQIFLNFREALRLEAQLPTLLETDDTETKDASPNTIPVLSSLQKAQHERDVLSTAYSWWKTLVSTNKEDVGSHLFDRFRCEHVLTRTIDVASASLGVLKEYNSLSEILESLLQQRRWGAGRRGAWYNQLAMVYMTHMGNSLDMLNKATRAVRSGLEDPETRLIYRHQLERRLIRLEKQLKLPLERRYKVQRPLRSAENVYITGCRVHDKSPQNDPVPNRTRWMGKEGNISVEQFALEHYSKLGYKGHHTESRILSTIYGLLFWDIIFLPIPGAFETPYQTAPLDIMELTFFSNRRNVIETRIDDIQNGKGRELILKVLEREARCRTACIGVHWTIKHDDILEIIECIEANALAIICRLISEDYRSVSGGAPDLILWNIHTKDCKFVEVKSDNDKLQENQKFWIDTLLRAGISVDLCNVGDEWLRKRKHSAHQDIANAT